MAASARPFVTAMWRVGGWTGAMGAPAAADLAPARNDSLFHSTARDGDGEGAEPEGHSDGCARPSPTFP